MLNIIIIDDQEQQINYLESLITSLNIEKCTLHKFQSAEAMLSYTKINTDYTIFLIDIVLTTFSGIELAKYINENFKGPVIIFISGYLDKVTDIFDTNHCYFIYKPELEQRLPHAIDKAITRLKHLKSKLHLVLKGKTVTLNQNDICFFERKLRNTIIKTKNENVTCTYNLEYFENILLNYFVKTHRSYIVNLTTVKEFSRTSLVLITGDIIPISRQYQKQVKEKWNAFLLNDI